MVLDQISANLRMIPTTVLDNLLNSSNLFSNFFVKLPLLQVGQFAFPLLGFSLKEDFFKSFIRLLIWSMFTTFLSILTSTKEKFGLEPFLINLKDISELISISYFVISLLIFFSLTAFFLLVSTYYQNKNRSYRLLVESLIYCRSVVSRKMYLRAFFSPHSFL